MKFFTQFGLHALAILALLLLVVGAMNGGFVLSAGGGHEQVNTQAEKPPLHVKQASIYPSVDHAGAVQAPVRLQEQPQEQPQKPRPAYQKPGAPVALATNASVTAHLGEVAESAIVLAIQSPGTTQITLRTDSAVELLSEKEYLLTQPGEVSLPITVVPQTAEKSYIHIHVQHTDLQGSTTTRALAFMVDARLANARVLQKEQSSDVIVMPATEVIHTD